MSSPASVAGGFSRFRIDLGYDGTDFAGWAKQPGKRTVAGELVAALSVIFGETNDDFAMRVAGRTDAGVHAEGQVAHFDLDQTQLARLGRSKDIAMKLNNILPSGIRVYSVALAPEGFNARFSALGRRYKYRISDLGAPRNPLHSRFTLWYSKPLDVQLMNLAAGHLLGLRDFAAFCKPRVGATTVRELRECSVERVDGIIEVSISADAFCHNMVRAIIGSLMAVGTQRLSVDRLISLRDEQIRTSEFKVMGPEGLSLVAVDYPADEDLAAQAELTKARRRID